MLLAIAVGMGYEPLRELFSEYEESRLEPLRRSSQLTAPAEIAATLESLNRETARLEAEESSMPSDSSSSGAKAKGPKAKGNALARTPATSVKKGGPRLNLPTLNCLRAAVRAKKFDLALQSCGLKGLMLGAAPGSPRYSREDIAHMLQAAFWTYTAASGDPRRRKRMISDQIAEAIFRQSSPDEQSAIACEFFVLYPSEKKRLLKKVAQRGLNLDENCSRVSSETEEAAPESVPLTVERAAPQECDEYDLNCWVHKARTELAENSPLLPKNFPADAGNGVDQDGSPFGIPVDPTATPPAAATPEPVATAGPPRFPINYQYVSDTNFTAGDSFGGLKVSSSVNCPQVSGAYPGPCQMGAYPANQEMPFAYSVENVSSKPIVLKAVIYGIVPNMGPMLIAPLSDSCRIPSGSTLTLKPGESCSVRYWLKSAVLGERDGMFIVIYTGEDGVDSAAQQTVAFIAR